MTTDKIVTHADLDAIKVIERECASIPCSGEAADLLRRLRAAAEADQPPLPEGWVLLEDANGRGQIPYWHESGWLFSQRDSVSGIPGAMRAASVRHRLSPLRPTITETDLEKAAEAADEYASDEWSWTALMKRAFEAAGIEVQS